MFVVTLCRTRKILEVFDPDQILSPRNRRDPAAIRSELAKRKDQLQEECVQMRRDLQAVGGLMLVIAGNRNPRIIGPP